MNDNSTSYNPGTGGPVELRPNQPPQQPLYHTPLYGLPRLEESPVFGEINVARLFRVLRRNWRLLLTVLGLALLLSLCYILTAPNVYRAECLVEMSLLRPRIMGQRGAVIDDAEFRSDRSDDILKTRLEKFKSPTVLDKAVSNVLVGVEHLPCKTNALRRLLKKNFAMQLVRGTRLLRITFDHRDRGFAVAAANAFADAAESLVAEESKTASDSAVVWLEAQAVNQRKALEKDDEALMRFDQENQIDKLEREEKRIEESLKGFNDVMTQIRSQQSLASDLYNSLAAIEARPGEPGKLPEAIPRAKEIESLVEQLVLAVSRRDELATKYTPKHPEVAAQEEVVRSLIRRAKETAAANLALLKQQSDSLRRNVEEQSKQAAELEQQIVERKTKRTALERSRDAADVSYKGVLGRIQEARLSADENTATVRIAERPRLPEKPVRPRKLVALALAVLIGLVGGVGLAFYTDALADHVSNAADIEQDLGLKVIGIVPHVESATDENTYAAGIAEASTPLSEAYAGIRGLLDSPQYEPVSQSVLVTSTAPGEGKTVSACNLAIASARSGRRTLLIDLDLRRPRIAAVLGLEGHDGGMREALKRQDVENFDRLPRKTQCEGLDIIAAREAASLSPADIVGGRTIRAFIEWAKKSYDRVIIDSPPFGIISDSAVLGTLVGSVILICRPNRSRKRVLQHAARHFQDIGANVIGVVANDVTLDQGFFLNNFSYYGVYGAETHLTEAERFRHAWDRWMGRDGRVPRAMRAASRSAKSMWQRSRTPRQQ